MTFLYSRYLGDKHCYKIPLKYLGKRGPVDDYIEANTWSLAYTRKINTCDYYPIDVPGSPIGYIACPSFASKVKAQLIVLSGQIQSGLITSKSAVLMVQELARRKRRKLADEALFVQLSSILYIAESANFRIDAAVAQDLFEYLDMLNDQFPNLNMSTPSVKNRSRTGSILRVTFSLPKSVKDFGWITLKRWASRMASTIRSVILNVHQDFAEHLLLTYPGVAVAFMTVDQLEACNSYLRNMRTVYPGDRIPEQLVKDIELCLAVYCYFTCKDMMDLVPVPLQVRLDQDGTPSAAYIRNGFCGTPLRRLLDGQWFAKSRAVYERKDGTMATLFTIGFGPSNNPITASECLGDDCERTKTNTIFWSCPLFVVAFESGFIRDVDMEDQDAWRSIMRW
ncbi:hypothetical protein C8R41DRAFT_924185 [Lentinula lateritia]|uniref:Uncharacterized protein n=1 Tax=Lentinula lateritia TaxID=40482 RepID=A0ABQ8V400_9AGAR|nr:hypothetical protein C8R41DRAFT_924185 [Lentinula lateritia]